MKLNLNFLGGGGEQNNLPWGGVWIFSVTVYFQEIVFFSKFIFLCTECTVSN